MADEVTRRDDGGDGNGDAPAGRDGERALERVSDADREKAADLVQRAAADGRLDLGELDERLGAVMASRTRRDLESALVHLPGASTVLGTAPPTAPAVRRDDTATIEGIHATVRRTGRWEVPSHVVIKTKHSSAVLDLMEAALPGPEIHIDVELVHSTLRLIVPEDIQVEAPNVTQKGATVRSKLPVQDATPPRAVIRVTGRLEWSSVIASGPGWRRRRALRRAAHQPEP